MSAREHDDERAPSSVQALISGFKEKQKESHDPTLLGRFISEKSDRKKYNYVGGLDRDVLSTRQALTHCCLGNPLALPADPLPWCTFGQVFRRADELGGIANLVRALQNLRRAGEIRFAPEMLYQGVHESEPIYLLPLFDDGRYAVAESNVFRSAIVQRDVPVEQRLGRSYVAENLETEQLSQCDVCRQEVKAADRLAFRGRLYHPACLSCAYCSNRVRDTIPNVAFDGQLCCSLHCLQQYDAKHQHQTRG